MNKRPPVQTWALLLVVAGVVALTGWWGTARLRDTLEGTLRTELETTLRANAAALEIWMANQARLATSLASEPMLRSRATDFLAGGGPASPSAKQTGSKPGAEDLGRYLQTRLAEIEQDGIFVINTNLEVMAASGRGRGRVGKRVLEEHRSKFAGLFATGQPVMIIPFRPSAAARSKSGRPDGVTAGRGSPPWVGGGRPAWAGLDAELQLMQVAAPIRDDAGIIRGALALVIDPEREFTRILSVTRLGNSGETYAFDQTGLMISRSRFDEQLKQLGRLTNQPGVSSVLNLRLTDPGGDMAAGVPRDATALERPLIRLVAAAVAGGAGVEIRLSRDYRGVPVVGAWRWLENYGLGLVTQQDATEAYQPLRVVRRLFLVLVLLLVLAAVGLLLLSRAHLGLRRRLGEAELKARELGQYRLEQKIGEGGMGVVYRARHALMRRDTAIKLLLPDRASREAIQQFEREVCLTCQLTHPNTIQIYDYGYTPEGMFYYVMEYLRGLNLKELVERFGPQPEGRVIHILNQVCDSLHEAHRKGMVHRDIKPANVFLSHRGEIPDSVKVLDFGLVREYRGASANQTSPVREDAGPVGTPLFMSPEAIQSAGSADPRSDIYSMGALGYYLVTGLHAFDDVSLAGVLRRQVEEQPTPPRQRTANPISPELERTILHCLEKEARHRPQSVTDLRALLAGSPRACDWDAAARTAWWTRFEAQPGSAATPPRGRPSDLVATVRVDVATRRL